MNKSSTRTVVAIGLGAAIFFVLFRFVTIPSPAPDTNFQIAYGVASFFGALYGPLTGFLVPFIGHALSDFTAYGSPWWSWVIASGFVGLGAGLCSKKIAPAVEEGKFGKSELATFLIWVVIANALAWLVIAPVLDIVIYAEPANKVFFQGIWSFAMDAVCSGLIGALLLKAYASTKVSKGSLSKDQ